MVNSTAIVLQRRQRLFVVCLLASGHAGPNGEDGLRVVDQGLNVDIEDDG